MFKYTYIYNMNSIDTYDIFNIEYSDNILDLYNKINDYCNPSYVNIHNNPNFPEFFNIIYKNVDIYNSSQFIRKLKKNENEKNLELEQEENYQHEFFDNL